MFNKVILVGNLTRDIELRYLQSNTAVGGSAIATTRKYKANNGEIAEETCFIDLQFWGKTAEIANQYLHKGSKILVEGRLKLDIWQDQNTGQNRQKHYIIVEAMKMLDSPNTQNNTQNFAQNTQNKAQPPCQAPQNNAPQSDYYQDEIPF